MVFDVTNPAKIIHEVLVRTDISVKNSKCMRS